MNNYFVAFADKKLFRSLARIKRQAEALGFFTKVFVLDDEALPHEFRVRFKDRLVQGSRGFGYWSWKPEVIKQTLNQIADGDALIYVDAGCHINRSGLRRLKEYFDLLQGENSGILAFQSKPPTKDSPLKWDGRKLFDQPNYRWIKGDLFNYFGARDDRRFTHAEAIGAGVILVKKCSNSMSIIDEWCSIIASDFSLLDDTPSKTGNIDGFIEHRHDQSIFSLLCLKYNIPTLSAYEYWYPKDLSSGRLVPDWDALKSLPIHARRDKDLGPLENFRRRLKNIMSRLWRIIGKYMESPIKNDSI